MNHTEAEAVVVMLAVITGCVVAMAILVAIVAASYLADQAVKRAMQEHG